MTKIRWAMVGTGLMADLIVRDFALCDNTELVAIVTRDSERAKPKFATWGIEPVTLLESLDAALADPNIDLIYVAAPHSEHFWMTKAALEAGKHVLCEKAFTMDADEAEELVRIARDRGLFLMEAMWTKFNPLMNDLKRRIEAGEIGDLKLIETHFGFHRPYDESHRLFDAKLGGGSTLDQGVYTTSVIDWFAGSTVKEMFSRGELYPNGTDAQAVTEFHYENGVIGVGASALNSTFGTTARIAGSDAYIDIDGPFWTPVSATIYRFGENDELLAERVEVPKDGAGYSHMIRAVSQSIIDGKTECMTRSHEESIRIMGLLDEIRAQVRANA
jgi:predicted dehydrogenase